MVELKDVTKVYGKGGASCTALNRIDLTLPDKGLVFIEGRSGSGKTTLLNLIAGFDSPTSGTVRTPGKNSCAMIFQDFQLIDMLTVRQNLEVIKNSMPQAKASIDELAERYGIAELLPKYPNQLSGGQKQRVAIARAVLENRPIIACDEPTGNLDEENAVMIADLLRAESADKLVLVVSHDKELFAERCDRRIAIKGGEVEEDSGADEVRADANVPPRDFPVKPGVKSQFFLSYRFFRRNLGKNVLLTIALFLAFTLVLSAFNGLLNTEGRVLYNVHRKQGDALEFVLQDDKYADEWGAMSDEEYAFAESCGRVEARFVDTTRGEYDDRNEIFTVTRLYVADRCARKMLCGTPSTAQSAILLSDYAADKMRTYYGLNDYADLLGREVWGDYRIGGVYATAYSERKAENPSKEQLEREYQTAYVSFASILDFRSDRTGICASVNGKTCTPYVETYRGTSDRTAEYGTKRPLADDEVAISVGIASLLEYDDPQELIGKTITVTVENTRNLLHYTPYSKVPLTRKVAYIVRGMTELVLNEKDYDAVIPTHNSTYFGMNLWGVRMEHCKKSGVQKLVAAGYTDASAWAERIGEALAWQRTLSYVELAVGAILLLVCVMILCNHVAALVDKEKRTLGVLVSLGIKVRHTVWVYLAGTVLSVLLCLAAGSLAEFAVVAGLNAIMAKAGIAAIRTFFYEPLAALCLFAVFVVCLLALYAAVVRKLAKKQIVDIIYER